jgi:hypothetical protein
MLIAMLTRTVVLAAYLLALLLNGSADRLSGLVAAAVIAVWVASLLRDRMLRREPAPRSR